MRSVDIGFRRHDAGEGWVQLVLNPKPEPETNRETVLVNLNLTMVMWLHSSLEHQINDLEQSQRLNTRRAEDGVTYGQLQIPPDRNNTIVYTETEDQAFVVTELGRLWRLLNLIEESLPDCTPSEWFKNRRTRKQTNLSATELAIVLNALHTREEALLEGVQGLDAWAAGFNESLAMVEQTQELIRKLGN